MVLFMLMLMGTATQQAAAPSGNVVYRFDGGASPWRSINDGVMGGLSTGGMHMEDGVAVFSGTLSLENNGGFSSIRSVPAPHDLAEAKGVLLRIRGDGRTYGLRLRTSDRFDGVSYQAKLRTVEGVWTEVRVPFRYFSPVFRGRQVPGYPMLNPAKVRTFGLILADKQPGDFRLELDWIKTF